VLGSGLGSDLGEEVLAPVDDLLVLVVPGGVAGDDVLSAGPGVGSEQLRGATQTADLRAQAAQHPLMGRAVGQRRHRVAQVDRAAPV
jgi:hypothetical protein